jgi:pyridoxine kinase
MKTVLSIQSQVAGARVGNNVAVFALERLGVNVIPLPTTMYARRPDLGPPGGGPTPPAVLAAMIDALEADGWLPKIDAIITGYFATPEQVDVAADAVARVRKANPAAQYLCDPVMGDDGAIYVKLETADVIIRKLIPLAHEIAPNAFELGYIVGRDVITARDAAAALTQLGAAGLVSSLPLGDHIGTLHSAADGHWIVETPLLPEAPKGTGDLLSALYLGRRMRGESTAMALEGAVGAVRNVIVRSLAEGSRDLAIIAAQDQLLMPDQCPKAIRL